MDTNTEENVDRPRVMSAETERMLRASTVFGIFPDHEAEVFIAYARLWAVSEALLLWHDSFLAPHRAWLYVLALLYATAAMLPAKPTLCCAMAARIAMYIQQAPTIWESCIWANMLDITFVWTALLSSWREVVMRVSGPSRTHMALFYVGAGYWKMNTSFLNPRVSCGAIYAASLLGLLPHWLVPGWLVTAALSVAPAATVLGELGLGVCLLLPSRATRRLGVLLAALLHYSIAITPFPNQVPAFGVFCLARLFFVMPEAWTVALQESLGWALELPKTAGGTAARAAVAALLAGSVSLGNTPGYYIDWCIPFQTVLCLLAGRAVLLDAQGTFWGGEPQRQRQRQRQRLETRGWLLRAGQAALLWLTFSYVFFFLAMGLMDVSATSPFSQVRSHGGSNHLIMPTGLLQQWAASHGELGGGVVRVTHCTSDHINALYPANCTHELPERVQELLHQFGHQGQEFNPTVRMMLGPKIRADFERWQPGSPEPFPAYTVPAFELKRLLVDARALGKGFSLDYEHLPGLLGDETWRQTSVASQVHLEDNGGSRSCTFRSPGGTWEPCLEDELALQPPPSGFLMKFMVFFPYPIIPGMDVLPCID